MKRNYVDCVDSIGFENKTKLHARFTVNELCGVNIRNNSLKSRQGMKDMENKQRRIRGVSVQSNLLDASSRTFPHLLHALPGRVL